MGLAGVCGSIKSWSEKNNRAEIRHVKCFTPLFHLASKTFVKARKIIKLVTLLTNTQNKSTFYLTEAKK